MNLPPEPGLRRRLVYGNNANYINMTSNRLYIPLEPLFYPPLQKTSNVSVKNLLENTKLIINKELDYCSICINDIDINNIIRVLKCKHQFHQTCIDTWLIHNNICPLCRTLV